ncbi:MAG: adenine phosphoribosyltransferase [Solirubrobacterales bacterium]|nr:adenine phosphoribosyltransferase [Solirubrobacterales bacterium]
MDLRSYVRDVPDFPRDGIVFRDITPLLLDPRASAAALGLLVEHARGHGPDLVVGIEARGLIWGGALAQALGVGFVPVRKPGKLPAETVSVAYELEYGVDALEVHADAIAAGVRVLVHDDLIATGGTAAATVEAVERLGGSVAACSFLIELAFLGGRDRLTGIEVRSLISYES